jgi:subtilisin-like proprotein convertase family protein
MESKNLFSATRSSGFSSSAISGNFHLFTDASFVSVLEETDPPKVITYTKTDVSCFGENTGSVVITVTGTTGLVIISWADGPTGDTRTNLPAGTYTVTVTDLNGPAVQAVAINQPAPLIATVSSANVSGGGMTDGTITITGASGGSGTYEYSIDLGLNWQSGGNFTGLAAGTYAVSMRDAASPACVVSLNNSLSISALSSLAISAISAGTPICQGSTLNLSVTATGGTGPYSYSWTGPDSFVSSMQNPSISNALPSASGVYQVTVTDAALGLVSSNTTATVNPTPSVTAPSDITYCNGATTAVIPLTGTPTGVVFDITGGSSVGLSDRTGVTAIPVFTAITGTATMSITPKANGCTGTTVNYIITVVGSPNVSSSPVSQTFCSGGTTNINLNSTTPGAVFNWIVDAISPVGSVTGASDGTGNKIIQTLTNITTGVATVTYQITPTANGCTGSPIHAVITVKPAPVLVIHNPVPLCSPATADLTASAITAGSTSGLTLTYWLDAVAASSFASPATAGAGTYYIKGFDAVTGCYTINPLTVTVNPTPTVVITNPPPVCAPGTVNLTLAAVTAGSTSGLTYTYFSDAAATTPYPTPATAVDETYYIKGTTAAGCSDLKPVDAMVYSTLGIPVFAPGTPSGVCQGAAPVTFTATAANHLGLTYSLDAASLTAGNAINSATGQVTFAAGWAGISQITATATGCGSPTSAVHAVIVNDPPLVSLVASPATSVCEGVPITLTATSSGGSTLHSITGTSGTVSLGIPDNSNTAHTYSTITLSGSGGSTLTPTDELMVTLNISHTNDGDLDIFLVDPSGTKAILLSSDNGGSGNHYTSTVFRTMYAVNSITTGTSPFTGTFIPEGSISTAPDRTGAAGGGNYNLVIPANALNGASIDGTWSLRVFDDANSTTGTIVSWSLSVTKQTGTGFTTVVNGSPTIGAVAYSGIFNSIATSVVTPPAGTNNYTVTTTDEDGCSATSNQVTLVVKPSPKPTIVADYCSHQPKIKLSATGSGSYLWSTGETTSTIDIDLVGIYTVTETGANGCTGTASINVSNELVVNGDFSSGNTGFVTPPSGANQYSYVSDIAGNSELNPEGLYGIGNNANNYHSNFWGFDHTTGTGKFMIVNGFPGAPQPVVWQQTHPVQPNTDYYFSAYAMSLNTAGNYAQLQFSINGTQIGTVATLTTGTGSNSNPWKPEDRFYGMWNSGSATSAIIQIVDLQTAASGNDFGLDDISFGTLSPLPATINPGVVVPLCEGSTISLTANLSNGKTPFTFAWTGPDGFTSALENPSIPNATIAKSGVYTLTFFDGYGCTPLTGDVSVSVGAIATAEAGPAQSVCASSPSVTLAGVIGGSATSATWSGGTGTFNPNANTLNAIYTPGASEIIAGTATLTLTTNPSGPCSTVTDQVTITIYPAVTASIIASSGPLCNGGSDGFATALGSGGAGPYLYSWNTTPVQTTATASNLSAGTYIVTVTGAHGCSDTETITLTEPPALLVDDNILTTHLTCYGDKNGTAKVTVISGLSPTYLWSDGQTTATATGLAGGSYIITVTSANGCAATALTAVIIEPIAPTIACPVDITKQADAGLTYATNVALTAPVYTNNCPMTVRTWTMTGVTTDSSPVTGIQLLTAHDFNIGITNINYTITDGAGNILNCTFGVTVLPNPPPVITCPTTILSNVDPGLCSANVTVIPATATGGGVTVVGVRSDGLPLTDPYPTGTVTITWTATNPYGTDFCTQLITVTDNIKPTFNVPAALEECVEIVAAATYNGATMDIDPDRPEYFTFVAGNTSLDLNPSTFGDNCPLSCVVEIRWKIDMHDGTRIPALPAAYQTGQPSAFGSDIRFLGDGVGHTNTIHTITYWIVDCSGNVSDPKTQTITIKPRPTIIGIN